MGEAHRRVLVAGLAATVAVALAAMSLVVAPARGQAQVTVAPGDVDCSGVVDASDAASILQYVVGSRSNSGGCPLANPDGELALAAADVNLDGTVDTFDALFVAQCAQGTANPLCPPVSPIADLEAEWAAQRQVIIDRLNSPAYGQFGNLVLGPGGFQMNLSTCPTSWSNTTGIDDDTITIAHTTAQPGSLAASGDIGAGWSTYVDYINEHGGIGPEGRSINLVIRDDASLASQAIDIVDDLLANDQPFHISTLGTPGTFAVRDALNDACVPHPLAMSGHPAWGDPQDYPFTTGLQMSYTTEALLWGKWIEANFAPGVKVAALVVDNDFGLTYEAAFEAFAEASPVIDDLLFVRHQASAPTLIDEIATIAGAEPDVFISMTAGNPCLLAIQQVARSGLAETAKALIQPSVCRSVTTYLAPAGSASDGWISLDGGFIDLTDPAVASDPFVAWMNAELAADGVEIGNARSQLGFGVYGWTHIQALQIAAELDGGLSRVNLMRAFHALQLDHPLVRDGIAFSVNGSEDAYLVEGSGVTRYSALTQQWVVEGVIDIDGQTPNCSWVFGSGCQTPMP